MSSKIEALPLARGKEHSWPRAPLAILAALLMAAGVAGYFVLRQNEPAASRTAVYENSGVIGGTGPGLARLGARFSAYRDSGPVVGTGPGLARVQDSVQTAGRGRALVELARQLAAYRASGAVTGTGPRLAELRGVDVIGILPPSVFPNVAALERAFGQPAIAASWPSVAALERAFGQPAIAASWPSVAALEDAHNRPSTSPECRFVRQAPC